MNTHRSLQIPAHIHTHTHMARQPLSVIHAKSIFIHIKSSIPNNSVYNKWTCALTKTVLVQTIQFCMSTQFSSIWPTDQVLPLRARVDLGAISMKEYSAFPQSSCITGTSLSDCLVSYLGSSFGGRGHTPLQRCSRCFLQPLPTGQHAQRGL